MRILKAARGRITGHFGDVDVPGAHVKTHQGTDIGHGDMTPDDTRVIAPAAGRVIAAGWSGTYGLRLIIDHGNGWTSLLAHLEVLLVAVGSQVNAGQTIGVMGGTGGNWPVHLHQELRRDGVPVDAEPYFTTLAGLGARPLTNTQSEEDDMTQLITATTNSKDGMIKAEQTYANPLDGPLVLLTASEVAAHKYFGRPVGEWKGDALRSVIAIRGRRPFDPKTGRANYSKVEY